MKSRNLLSAIALGLGLPIVLLLLLARPTPVVRANPGIYYAREGGTSTTCTIPTDPCGSIQQAINLATSPGDEVWVATGTYTENLIITHSVKLRGGWDISFATQVPATHPTTIDGSGAHVISVTLGTDPALIDSFTIRNGRDGVHLYSGVLTLTNNFLHSTTKQAIEVTTGTVWVESNTIADTGEEGFRISGGTAVLSANQVYNTGSDGLHTDPSSINVEIHGNTVYSTSSDGIDARGQTIVLASNVVHSTGKDGIHVDDASTAHIQYNTVYDINDDGVDAGGGTILIAGNFVDDCGGNGIKSEGADHTTVSANQIFQAGSAGLDLDDAGTFTATNNIVADSSQASVLVETDAGPHNLLYHNTLVGSATGQQGTGINVTVTGFTITLANNIIVSHSVGITATPGATLIVSNTLLWGNGDDPISGTAVLPNPPLLVAPAQQNYHLLPDSPAVDAGIDVGVSTDVDGDARPAGLLPDVGADEVWFKVYLPLTLRAYPPGALLNPGFEGIHCHPDSEPGWCLDNWTHDAHDGSTHDNIFTPQGWVTWWRKGVPYGQPEVKTIPNVPPYTGEPPRIRSGNYAVLLFTFYRLQDTGLYQVVTGLEPGATVQFSAHAHGWSCDKDDPMGYTCGDPWNQTFQVGIEPNGVADPFSPSIVWSPEQQAPDHYTLIGPATAQVGAGGNVCVYLRSKTRWAYKYQDAYWDDARLTVQSH
jgi:archaellum component FlaG (FlaF/FlaG flagellin family)